MIGDDHEENKLPEGDKFIGLVNVISLTHLLGMQYLLRQFSPLAFVSLLVLQKNGSFLQTSSQKQRISAP